MRLREARLHVRGELAAQRFKGATLDTLGIVDPRTGRPPTTWQRAEELLVGDALRTAPNAAVEIARTLGPWRRARI